MLETSFEQTCQEKGALLLVWGTLSTIHLDGSVKSGARLHLTHTYARLFFFKAARC